MYKPYEYSRPSKHKSVVLITPCTSAVNDNPKAGIETIVDSLARSLHHMQYNVHVIATHDSRAEYLIHFATPHTIVDKIKELLNLLTDPIICDHSGTNLHDIFMYKNLYRIFHIQPIYVYPGKPSPKTGFVSRYLRTAYAKHVDKNFNKCPVIDNGINDKFKIDSQHSAIEENDKPVLYLGRICITKGIDIAAHACFLLDIPFHIYGGYGIDKPFDYIYNNTQYLKKILNNFPIAEYKGSISNQTEKFNALYTGSCLVLPTREPESASLVALEAALAGIRVISFDKGGIRQYLKNKAYYTNYKNEYMRDVVNFSKKISEAVNDSTNVSTPYLKSRYTVEAMTKRYIEWWNK